MRQRCYFGHDDDDVHIYWHSVVAAVAVGDAVGDGGDEGVLYYDLIVLHQRVLHCHEAAAD